MHSRRVGPRLEALLGERDQVRIDISRADAPGADPRRLSELQRQRSGLDLRILKGWETPEL
jgi:hypothetical protein